MAMDQKLLSDFYAVSRSDHLGADAAAGVFDIPVELIFTYAQLGALAEKSAKGRHDLIGQMILLSAETVTVFGPLHRVFAESRDPSRDEQSGELEAGVAQTYVCFRYLYDHVRHDARGGAGQALRVGGRFRRTSDRRFGAAVGDEVVIDAHAVVRPLNRTAVGRVVFCGRQRQPCSPSQRVDGLHESLSKALLANQSGAATILQRRGDDLRGRSRLAVDQDDHRHGFRSLILRKMDLARITPLAPAHRNDLDPFRQEGLGHLDRLLQQPAGIAPQVQNQRIHPLLLEFPDRAAQLLCGLLVESADQADVTDPGLQHEKVADRWEWHLVASDLHGQRLGRACALDNYADFGVALPAHIFQRVRL